MCIISGIGFGQYVEFCDASSVNGKNTPQDSEMSAPGWRVELQTLHYSVWRDGKGANLFFPL